MCPTWRRMRRFCWLSAIWCCTRSRGVAGREVALRGVDAHERGEDARLSGLGASDSASSLILYLRYKLVVFLNINECFQAQASCSTLTIICQSPLCALMRPDCSAHVLLMRCRSFSTQLMRVLLIVYLW